MEINLAPSFLSGCLLEYHEYARTKTGNSYCKK